jgi:hypothetical protein
MLFFLFVSALIATACGSEAGYEAPGGQTGKGDFIDQLEPLDGTPLDTAFYETHRQVLDALANRRYDELDAFIDPDCGIFKLNKGGIYFEVSSADRFEGEFLDLLDGRFRDMRDPQPANGLPYLDCKDNKWSLEGAFAAPISGYTKLSTSQQSRDEVFAESPEYEPSSQEYMDKLGRCEDGVVAAVSNTADLYTLSYSKVGDRWTLTVIDLTSPCE